MHTVRHYPEMPTLKPSIDEMILNVPREISGVWNDIPGKSHGDILVVEQSVPIVPEIIFGVHRSVVQHSVLPPQDDFVP